MTLSKSVLFTFTLSAQLVCAHIVEAQNEETPIRVGWIGAMTGALSKYSAYQSAIFAQEEINAEGGINGRKLELIFEDGRGDGKTAAIAAQKLIGIEKVKYIIGGHCSPETLAIAPIAERSKTLLLAAITSNPKLTNSGDYIFRVTAVSTRHADLLAPYAVQKLGLKKLAVLHEETDYAGPPAEHFANLIKKAGVEVVEFQSYHPGDTDFRTILTKIKNKKADGLYVGVQSPDTAVLIMQQIQDLRLDIKLFGNEITGATVMSDPSKSYLFEGMVFGEPRFDVERPQTKNFIERYKKRFNTNALPFGFWSAEAYDAVRVLAKEIADCGDSAEQVRDCLYKLEAYPGVSSEISIDTNGDGIRNYLLKEIKQGKITPITYPD